MTPPITFLPPKALPECCYASADAPLEQKLYAAYNQGGLAKDAGLNYAGNPCPLWADLPQNVQMKWRAVAGFLRLADATDAVGPSPGPPVVDPGPGKRVA